MAATLATTNRRTAAIAAAFALAMVALAFAAVPLYRAFCQATGFAGTTGRAEAAALPSDSVLRSLAGRTVKVRFDANISPGMPWQFVPTATETTIKVGEKRMAFYRATNLSAAPVTGRAVYNVSPDLAGKYFKKIQCFCFNEQTLKAGEVVDMPLTYFIDPAILNDPQASKIDEITLSYTFFPVDERSRAQLDTQRDPALPGGAEQNKG
jgi:cytochrome c oxidase assembly protein subunit 11